MGGTFDPIHNAHLMLGRQALKEYHLDEIWFMPSHNPPHKTDHRVTGTKDRCEMVKLAIAGEPRFRFSDFDESYGLRMADGPLAGLLARAVVVIGKDGKVAYTELVPEITQEPDYEKALAAVKE